MTDLQIRDLLSRWLTARGFRSMSAESAATALRHLESEPIDLMTVDISMPEVSVINLLHTIREIRPQTAVLTLTAVQTSAIAIEASQRGLSVSHQTRAPRGEKSTNSDRYFLSFRHRRFSRC
jgi:two-component system response regulator PrrA